MISKIINGTLKLLEDVYNKYGLNVHFSQSPEMSYLKYFENYRIKDQKDIYDSSIDDELKKYLSDSYVVGLYSFEAPMVSKNKNDKLSLYAMSSPIPSFNKKGVTSSDKTLSNSRNLGGVTDGEVREFIVIDIPLIFSILTQENEAMENITFTYLSEIIRINSFELPITISGESINLPYQTTFSEISEWGFVGIPEFGTLRKMDFRVTVSGAMISPFYIKGDIIERVDIKIS